MKEKTREEELEDMRGDVETALREQSEAQVRLNNALVEIDLATWAKEEADSKVHKTRLDLLRFAEFVDKIK